MAETPRQAGAEIEVTEEMMEAGVRLYWQSDIPDDKEGMARFMALVYRVMSLAQHSRRAEVEEMLRTEREFL
jgi:hypothetical protein